METESLKYQTKKGLYWKLAEQVSTYGIQFVIGIFMARLLSPEDYGITALPGVFMAIAGIFASGSFGTALIRKPELKEEDLSTAFYYSMGVGIMCYIILFFASPWIADFYNTPVLKPLMRVTALGFLYGPISSIQSTLMSRKLDFKTPAKISVITTIVAGISGISLAYYGYGVWALVLSGMISAIIGHIIRIWVVRWYPKTGWSKESFRYLWGFGNKLMGSYLISTIYENIAPIIIGKFFSTAQLGSYNRALGYASLPSQNLTVTLKSVTFPILSKVQNDDDTLAHSYRKMLRVSAFVVFPLMMSLAVLARPLIITMITEKWESCITLLQIMCFSMMWYPIHSLNLNLLQVKGRSDLFFRLELIKRGFGLLVLCISLPLGLEAFCWGGVVSSLISLFINTYYTGKMINVGYLKQMKDLSHIIILSFVMCFFMFITISYVNNFMLQLFLGSIIGMFVYIGGASILKFSELEDIKYMLNRGR